MATKRPRWLVLAACAACAAAATALAAEPDAVDKAAAAKVPEAVAKLIEAASKPLVDEPLVALGRRLFQDPTVSRSAQHACASCHDAEHGWSDARRVSVDFDGPMRRHSQPTVDLVGNLGASGFHWDGALASPEELVETRIGDPSKSRRRSTSYYGRESSSPSPTPADDPMLPLPIAARLVSDGRYATAFKAAFKDEKVTTERAVEAVTAFIESVRTAPNALDRSLAGDATALSESAKRGLELFRGRAACATCHTLATDGEGRAHLTDGKFHNTGVAFAPVAASSLAAAARTGPDLGRFIVSRTRSEMGAFKTPSLRDVARRAPYMHDGSLATLEDVVRYYAKGGTPNETLDRAIRPVTLSDLDVADVVAFLESLSGEKRAGLLPARAKPVSVKLTLMLPSGERAAGVDFDVLPFGERLGADPVPAAFAGKASAIGVADIEFPQTTHVLLRSETHDIAYGRPIPDTAGELEVLAVPRDRVLVALTLKGTKLPARLTGTEVSPRVSGTPTVARDGKIEISRAAAEPGCDLAEPERFVFERLRETASGETIYAAPLGTIRGRTFLRFDIGGDSFGAAVDLDGGWSEPAALRPMIRERTKQ